MFDKFNFTEKNNRQEQAVREHSFRFRSDARTSRRLDGSAFYFTRNR